MVWAIKVKLLMLCPLAKQLKAYWCGLKKIICFQKGLSRTQWKMSAERLNFCRRICLNPKL